MSIYSDTKHLLQSKTFWLNFITTLVMVGTMVLESFGELISPEVRNWIGLGVALANIYLRTITGKGVHILPKR